MEFRHPYMSAMQEQNPKLYRRLRDSGELDRFVEMKAREAARMFQELTKDAPKENGYPKQPFAREAEEQVRAAMFEFPDDMETNKRDEVKALMDERPVQ